jgi:uncharacterized membrane protein
MPPDPTRQPAAPLPPPETPPLTERRLRRAVMSRAFKAMKAQKAADRTATERLADLLTELASSTPFLIFHVLWFATWIAWNLGAFGLPPFDPYPFGFLTLVVSLEAIFLSIFVLLGQRREGAIAELREEVTLAVILRAEEEITKTLQLVAGLYTRLGHRIGEDEELQIMLQPLDPERIEQELIAQIRSANVGSRRQE